MSEAISKGAVQPTHILHTLPDYIDKSAADVLRVGSKLQIPVS
ncbi:MAG: hypothetical protein OXI87_16925 [Albidovulum sp.]|nr:hypothetical protein [Albidovulum sp.]